MLAKYYLNYCVILRKFYLLLAKKYQAVEDVDIESHPIILMQSDLSDLWVIGMSVIRSDRWSSLTWSFGKLSYWICPIS